MQQDFRTILSSDCYTYDEKTGTYTDLRNTDTGLKYLYDNALKLPWLVLQSQARMRCRFQRGFIGYTSKLTEYIIERHQSDAVKAQQENPNLDIFTGLPFKDRMIR